jgi:hypothetical protein
MSCKVVGGLFCMALMLTLAAIPAPAQQGRGFDGTWTLKRSVNPNQKECGHRGAQFRIRIKGGVVSAPGGRGSVTPSGAIRFPGMTSYFTGTLQGNVGQGTSTGRCGGPFSARRG